MTNTSIWSVDRTLTHAIIPGQIGPGDDGSERVLHIPQKPSITEASKSVFLVS